MKLISFIVPVYNEEHTIEEVLGKLGKIELGLKKEIIVINDGSTDGTVKIVQAMQKKYDQIKLFAHETNLGKGSALNTGFKYSSGDIIAIQDADLEYNIEDFKKLIQPIILNKFKVVYGSRFLKKNPEGYFLFYLGNKFLSMFTSIIYFTKITDMETCYKVFESSLIKNLDIESKGFEIEPEITSKILRKGYKILEIPIGYSPRSKSEGKKIKVIDGFKALWTLIKYRFN